MVQGALYLPALHAVLRAANLQPFHRAVALLNSQVCGLIKFMIEDIR